MSQKLNINNLSDYENKYIHFNFTFCLLDCELGTTHYAKVFKKIIKDHSKITTKMFSNKTKIEYNNKIIERQNNKNFSFIQNIYNGDSSKFKATYDIYREIKGLRAYGNLVKNIFYVLEIDSNHNSR